LIMNKKKQKEDKDLSPELYQVARNKGTEAPFTGKYWANHEQGVYKCAICGTELFSSEAKFDSGTGWPSFTEPANLKHIELKEDKSHGMARTEVVCKTCGAHLGHVFDDLPETYRSGRAGGPPKSGKRYCVNSVCLELTKKETTRPPQT
jgi:peptide-methionine (R)-S-oxide reductase